MRHVNPWRLAAATLMVLAAAPNAYAEEVQCLAYCAPDAWDCPPCAGGGGPCPTTVEPVLCPNGVEYTNECYAFKAGLDPATCEAAPVGCPTTEDPVRCSDGVEYTNSCLAEEAGQTQCLASIGSCYTRAPSTDAKITGQSYLLIGYLGDARCTLRTDAQTFSGIATTDWRVVRSTDEDQYCLYRSSAQQDFLRSAANSFGPFTTLPQCPAWFECASDVAPVTCDGVEYANECGAQAAGEDLATCTEVDQCAGEDDGEDDGGGGPTACQHDFQPVTCPDGETYANACSAGSAGQDPNACTDANGNGGAPTACQLDFQPVTCPNGETYANACSAGSAGQDPNTCTDANSGGTGGGPTACTLEYIPYVCANGISGPNECFAAAMGGINCVPDDGTIPDPVDCTDADLAEYEPVCGDDGQTYNNFCVAELNGAGIAHGGVCAPEECEDTEPEPGACVPGIPGAEGLAVTRPGLATCADVYRPEGGRPGTAADGVEDLVCGCDGYVYLRCVAEGGPDWNAPSYWSDQFVLYEEPAFTGTWDQIAHGYEMVDGVRVGTPCQIVEEGEPAICDLSEDHVCGTDGVTYANPWLAAKAGATVDYPGECDPCRDDSQQVCGSDGTTYDNWCAAVDAGTTILDVGACVAIPNCSELPVDLVCGGDDITYRNSCEAEVAGQAWTAGECLSCEGLSGAQWGLCNAYCNAQQCYLTPTNTSCVQVKSNFVKKGGQLGFDSSMPCADQYEAP